MTPRLLGLGVRLWVGSVTRACSMPEMIDPLIDPGVLTA